MLDEIHDQILARGAMTITSADGFTHHVLYRGENWIDVECSQDGAYTLQASINGEIDTAHGLDVDRIVQVWQRWLKTHRQ